MATHLFTIRSGIPSGGQDAILLYHADIDIETFLQVRDSAIANNANFVATWGYLGCGYNAISGTYPDEWTVGRIFFFFKQLYDLVGANIESVSIRFDTIQIFTMDWHYDIVIQKANSPDIHHQPPIAEDYNKVNIESAVGGSKNTTQMVDGAWVTIDLNATGIAWLGRNINDILKVVLRSSDDIDGKAPINTPKNTWHPNHMSINTGNASSAARPYLYITITVTLPAATTHDPTDVAFPLATFNGEVVDRGHWLGSYGFEWKKGLAGSVTSVNIGFSSNQTVTTFSYNKTGLIFGSVYYYRAWANNESGKGYGEWKEVAETAVMLENVRADNIAGHCYLYGEITEITGAVIIERGFEYLVQENEPSAEDTGTEVKETKVAGFSIGEYHLSSWDTFRDLYCAPLDTVWWFRAYCKDDRDVKYIATMWMKNLPNVITQDMTNINYNKADGNGLIVSEGASELTMRGFEVIHEFSGRLPDSWRFEIGGFEGEPEQVIVHDSFGVTIIDIYWAGTLIKTVLEIYALAVGAYSMTIGRMLLGWPIMQDCLVEGKAYKCIAFAENEFGRAYGEEVGFSTWARSYFSEDSPTTGETTVIKNENIENLPVGITASRRGFRYGTTEAADEFDVHEDGSFTNGPYSMMLVDLLPDTTYYIVAYIVVQGIVYEGEMEIITTDPEGTEDEDEYPTPHFSPHGQDYREIETKVFAEVLASIGIIEFSGGKKTLPITNHLIQTNPEAKTIADNYLNRFKLAKTRMSVSYPTPLPFEREDTIDFSYGALLFKNDDEGIAHFKEDGEGVSVLMDQITMIIKQINSVGLNKTQTSIEYVAELDLEHE